MKTDNLDWAAPIIPGNSMMGLTLGMALPEVWDLLMTHKVADKNIAAEPIIQFKNSPILLASQTKDGIILRDTTSQKNESSEFDKSFTLGFRDGKLVHLMTSLIYGANLDYYKGKIWGEVGLGSPVAAVLKHCHIEFDTGDELFYPSEDSVAGLSLGGACSSLEDDPEQVVSYIRVYSPR